MSDQSSAHEFADEDGEIRRHGHHAILQVFEELRSIVGYFDDLGTIDGA